jgi:hypothetical protein
MNWWIKEKSNQLICISLNQWLDVMLYTLRKIKICATAEYLLSERGKKNKRD